MRKVLGLTFAVLLGACSQDETTTSPQNGDRAAVSTVGPEATAEQRANDEKWHISERPDFRTAERIPEFAGAHFDSSSGAFVVRVTSLDRTEEAAQTFLSELDAMVTSMGGRAMPRNFKTEGRLADYSFRQLADYRAMMWSRFPEAVRIIDVNEATNRLELGVSDLSAEVELRSTMEGLGIPREAVVMYRAEEDKQTSCPGQYLWDPGIPCRPITGGTAMLGGCTIGPVGRDLHFFSPYALTNGHCTSTPHSLNAGDLMYQGGVLVGHEVFDRLGVPCGKGFPCRHADVAVFTIDNWADFAPGRVARTFNYATGWYNWGSDIINSPSPTYFNYLGWTSALMYQPAQKVGMVTGWTRGMNIGRCADVQPHHAGIPDIWVTCQDKGSYFSDAGDSGSPVSWWVDPNDILYTGISWGVHTGFPPFTPHHSWYSPMTQIIGEYQTGGLAIVF